MTGLAVTVLAALCTACGDSDSADGGPAGGPSATAPTADALDVETLEAAMPDVFSVYPDVAEALTRKAWEASDAQICLSNEWPRDWCAKADVIGSSGFTNMEDQTVTFDAITFPDVQTAEALFPEGDSGEGGENPPGDEVDEFNIERPDRDTGWTGHGIYVRQGSVIVKVAYTWEDGAFIESGAMETLTRMAVKRIQQAQQGENPTASVR